MLFAIRGKETGMQRRRNEIRGPTVPDKVNDRAGNAAVHETDRDGSGTNQPSRVSRFQILAPAASVGGRREDVKVSAHAGARITLSGRPCPARQRGCVDQSDGQETDVAGNRVNLPACSITASAQYTESGTAFDER